MQSCKVIFWGFFWSAVFGLPIGILCGTFRSLRGCSSRSWTSCATCRRRCSARSRSPCSACKTEPKIAIIFIGTFFQMVLIVSNTTRSVEVSLLHAAQTLGANKRQLVWNVVGARRRARALPRHAHLDSVGMDVLYLVVAELIGEKSGLSAWLYQQQRYRHFDNVYAAIVIIGLVGLATDQFLALLGRYLVPLGDRSNQARAHDARSAPRAAAACSAAVPEFPR